MGIHTGDSITIAPAMTLSDAAYQENEKHGNKDDEVHRRFCRWL